MVPVAHVVGMLSCAVPPLAWGHHWVWTVPLLAVIADQAVPSAGRRRWSWGAAAAATYLAVFMWFNAWLYRTSLRPGRNYPTYVEALDAAIDHMTKLDKLLAVAHQPLLFFVVAVVTIMLTAPDKAPQPRRA